MKLSEYISERGNGANLAAEISAPHSSITNWANGTRPVPTVRCPAIEVATAGQVTRRDLRPNDWHLIWPELVTDEFPAPDRTQTKAAA